jgi:hypothetical protein
MGLSEPRDEKRNNETQERVLSAVKSTQLIKISG